MAHCLGGVCAGLVCLPNPIVSREGVSGVYQIKHSEMLIKKSMAYAIYAVFFVGIKCICLNLRISYAVSNQLVMLCKMRENSRSATYGGKTLS